MVCTLGNPTDGTITFKRLLTFDDSEPERPGEKFRSLTGPTVHQISQTEESDREFNVDVIIKKASLDILKALHRNTSTLTQTFQDGEAAYTVYIKTMARVSNPRKDYHVYALNLRVIEKLSA